MSEALVSEAGKGDDMWFSIFGKSGLLLFSLTLNLVFAGPVIQKYAPVVGRWRVELSIEEIHQSLEFETDGEGVYGLGTGYFVASPVDARSRQYPAAWSNIDPQQISITGEINLQSGGKSKRGTLLLRTKLAPGQDIKGDALFIDEALGTHRGAFKMKLLLGPEQLMEKNK